MKRRFTALAQASSDVALPIRRGDVLEMDVVDSARYDPAALLGVDGSDNANRQAHGAM